jgi:hypothetical protein
MKSNVIIAPGDTSPNYKWLQRKSHNGVSNASVDWNFNKFLIDECGHWVAHYSSSVVPTSTLITSWITSQACSVSGLQKTDREGLLLFPPASPASGHLDLQVPAKIALSAKIEILSVYGQACSVKPKSSLDASGKVSYDISELAAGIYLLRVSSTGHEQVYKFLVNP